MALSNDGIERIAKLARLKIDPQDIADYKEKMNGILGYVRKLSEVDVEGVPEMQHAAGQVNVYRDDAAEGCDADTRARLVEAFPRKEGDLLAVQAVFADRTE